MKQVINFVLEENVWEPRSWNGEGITNMWSKKWHRFDTYLCTEGYRNKIGCMEKSQKGQISWKICYNFMQKKLFEGNRLR